MSTVVRYYIKLFINHEMILSNIFSLSLFFIRHFSSTCSTISFFTFCYKMLPHTHTHTHIYIYNWKENCLMSLPGGKGLYLFEYQYHKSWIVMNKCQWKMLNYFPYLFFFFSSLIFAFVITCYLGNLVTKYTL